MNYQFGAGKFFYLHGAADVIGVCMGNKDVLDIGGAFPHCFQVTFNFLAAAAHTGVDQYSL